ncbi:DUF4367 domain-containing protein [Brevibacillus ruminantium]|uniref:DUF4367 domain-containing protein n=1 Tax=Brevibacillus ruminantium TaxID=2950604 RepID=A0ABY4WEY5_9BACL|nr:DUF4367 domain-containing protein [Brevibacillus ruminantium]USG65720.1 DUF4367 domain-containing protein [Brevibacillus ruminantium]
MKKKTNMNKQVTAFVLGALLITSIAPTSTATDWKSPSAQASASSANQAQLSQQPISSITQDKVTAISKKGGFELHFPSYIPGDKTSINLNFSEKTKHVVASFFSQAAAPFYLEMWNGDIAAESKGLTMIATNKGTSYQGTQEENFGNVNVLVWEEEKGVIYRLVSKLSQEELLKIAESVKKGVQIKLIEESSEEQVLSGLNTTSASELFGSPIQIPSYLPSSVKQESVAISCSINKSERKITIYDQAAAETGSYFSLDYEKGSLTKEYTAETKPIQLVQGTAFIGNAPLLSFTHPEIKQLPLLVWEEDGVVYTLRANTSVEELKKIAESLSK